jgi:hypothetical protein
VRGVAGEVALLADTFTFAFNAVEALVDLLEAAIDAFAEVVEPPVCPFHDHRLRDDAALDRNVLSVVGRRFGTRHDFHANARQ